MSWTRPVRPLLDAPKQIGVHPRAVDAAAEEAQRSGRTPAARAR
jgi:type IV pilus assembly protein PilB